MLEMKFDRRDDPPRILVVGEVLIYREGIARWLDQTGRYRIVAACDGATALALIAVETIDVVLLDASEADALALARAVRVRREALPVVGFGLGGDADSLACVEAGLRGFVGRDGSFADLACAIDRAMAGEVLCSSRLAALLCDRLAGLSGAEAPAQPSPLTRREQEIARLVAEGLSNKEIAIELRIGPATVKNHIHSMLDKLGVARRSGIAARLMQWQSPAPQANAAPLGVR